MKLAVYNEIIGLIRTYKTRDALPQIAERFPGVSMHALGSIYAQEYQKKMRKTHHIHYHADKMELYYDLYQSRLQDGQKHILGRIAEEIDLSPALLARIIVERHLSRNQYNGENAPKSLVTQLMKDPSLITDPVLATEVHECVINDDQYGCLVDSIKHSIGHEYEFKLKYLLDSHGIPYIGEEHMRARGYDKTPDTKLEVPISVDGHVVNWIESKASFGDEYSNKAYLKDQYWSYWNRFGPGMVIYWFGFIDELNCHQEKGILLRDSFPENIVKLNPLMK